MRSTLKHRDPISRQRICKRKLLSIALLFYRLVDQRPLLAFPAVFLVIAVEDQLQLFSPRHAHSVIRALHRSEVAHKEQVLLPVFGMSHKAVNAAEAVIRIDPLESRRIRIQLVHCLILFIEMEQISVPVLDHLMLRLCQQEPVEFPLLAPLSELREFLSHKEQFLAGMACHKSISNLQVRI